ncbi:unnamed protein product [Ixodes pacificus]
MRFVFFAFLLACLFCEARGVSRALRNLDQSSSFQYALRPLHRKRTRKRNRRPRHPRTARDGKARPGASLHSYFCVFSRTMSTLRSNKTRGKKIKVKGNPTRVFSFIIFVPVSD